MSTRDFVAASNGGPLSTLFVDALSPSLSQLAPCQSRSANILSASISSVSSLRLMSSSLPPVASSSLRHLSPPPHWSSSRLRPPTSDNFPQVSSPHLQPLHTLSSPPPLTPSTSPLLPISPASHPPPLPSARPFPRWRLLCCRSHWRFEGVWVGIRACFDLLFAVVESGGVIPYREIASLVQNAKLFYEPIVCPKR